MKETRGRQTSLGPDAVRFGSVKVYVGTNGNELAGQLAEEGVALSEEWGEHEWRGWRWRGG